MEGLEKTVSQPPQWLLVSILHRVPCLFSLYSEPLTHTAPSAAPSDVSGSPVNHTTITVQWGPVNCVHRNGEITGYSVQNGEMGSESTQIMRVSGNSSGGMATISGLSPATMYTVVVAAENSAGTGDYSDPLSVDTPDSECTEPDILFCYDYNMHFFCILDVYLSLNGDIIPNHGYVMISDIGSSGSTALLCHTNRPATLGTTARPTSGGDWFAPGPYGTRVDGTAVSGLRRNRGPMVVRLLRNNATGTPAEGIYDCVIEDDTLTLQTVYVGLYNSGGGIVPYDEQSFFVTL